MFKLVFRRVDHTKRRVGTQSVRVALQYLEGLIVHGMYIMRCESS